MDSITRRTEQLIDKVRRFITSCTKGPPFSDTAAAPDDSLFNEVALEVFQFQYENNATLRSLGDLRQRTPGTVTHWQDIPSLPTAAFKEFELTTLPPDQRRTTFHSSGTTGHRPSRHFHSAASLDLYRASLTPWFQRHLTPGIPPLGTGSQRPQFLSLTPSPAEAPHSSLAHMLEQVRLACGGTTSHFAGSVGGSQDWTFAPESVVDWLRQRTVLNQPVALCGTAFNFIHLLDWLISRDERLQLPAGTAVMETGGYKGRSRELPRAELHQLISQRLGVPDAAIICEYGMCELGSQAYDRVAGDGSAPRRFRFPPWARARIVSPESGREEAEGRAGLIQVFDLANVCSSLAVQTEDLAIRHDDGFELIGRAVEASTRGCSLMSA